jgi:type I restriction-modification system, specificity subunit
MKWRRVKLGEILESSKECRFVEHPLDEKLISVQLHGKGAVQRVLSQEKAPSPFKGFVGREGQIVYSRIWARKGAIAKIGKDLDGVVVSSEFPLFNVCPVADIDYLIYAFQSSSFKQQLELAGAGTSGQNRIKEKAFLNFEIPLPPLGEQKRIAEILGGVANAIHTVEQQIETANQLEKSLFNQFRRQYSALCSPIKNICKVQTGATPSRKNSAYYDGGIPWVKTGEVNGGKIEETEEYITELAVQETNCRKFPIGTILVAMYGQGATRGKVGILNCAAATNQACAALIALACEDQEYIFAVLRNCYDELRNLGRGGTQPNLNLTLVKEFEIPWPEEFAREEFSQKWRELDNLRHLLHRKLSLLQELQKSLATRAFAGLL